MENINMDYKQRTSEMLAKLFKMPPNRDEAPLNLNRCVPRYWTNKELDKLREAKKVELNDWNKEVLAKITEGMPDVFSKGRTQDGLTCIVIEKVGTRLLEIS